jgi:hypothetical protein
VPRPFFAEPGSVIWYQNGQIATGWRPDVRKRPAVPRLYPRQDNTAHCPLILRCCDTGLQLGTQIGTGQLRIGLDGTCRHGDRAASRRKSHSPVRDRTGRDGNKRISRPPRSTALAPLRGRSGEGRRSAAGTSFTTAGRAAHTGGARSEHKAAISVTAREVIGAWVGYDLPGGPRLASKN